MDNRGREKTSDGRERLGARVRGTSLTRLTVFGAKSGVVTPVYRREKFGGKQVDDLDGRLTRRVLDREVPEYFYPFPFRPFPGSFFTTNPLPSLGQKVVSLIKVKIVYTDTHAYTYIGVCVCVCGSKTL